MQLGNTKAVRVVGSATLYAKKDGACESGRGLRSLRLFDFNGDEQFAWRPRCPRRRIPEG